MTLDQAIPSVSLYNYITIVIIICII